MPVSVASRIVLVPVIAAISYEIIRFSGARAANPLVRIIFYPSLALQALTTRKPDDDQIEVAIRAMNHAIAVDEGTAEPDGEAIAAADAGEDGGEAEDGGAEGSRSPPS